MQESSQITRKSASNLALAFILLPKPKRDAMAGLYAFCREVDDVADEESRPVEERRSQLQAWRNDIRAACNPNGSPQFIVNREIQPIIQTYQLPLHLFDELIQGCEMDLSITRYASLDELEKYCYRVASVVGLLSIRIFGYSQPGCTDYAFHLGQALQLTNILRDVHTDAARGRIYLPLDLLHRFNVTEADILEGRYSDRYRRLAQEVGSRARYHYQKAREVLPAQDRRSMIAAELMGSVYWRLLTKLEKKGFNVFTPKPTRLSKPHKILLIARTWWRSVTGTMIPNYGA